MLWKGMNLHYLIYCNIWYQNHLLPYKQQNNSWKYLHNHISNKGSIAKLHKEFIQINIKINN